MLLDLIRKRQSVRRYLARPVAREALERCLEAARLAPSACNSQPWHFVVLDDPDLVKRAGQVSFNGPYAMNAFAGQAPVLVAVVSEKSKPLARAGGFIRGTPYHLIDIGIAIEHFCLQAAELDLGTCYLGWFNEKGLKKHLGVPAHKKIDILIALGYPQDAPRSKNRKGLSEILTYNRGRRPW